MTDSIKIPFFHRFANVALRGVYRVLLQVDVRGLENVPSQGGFIIAINHNSFLDPLIPVVYVRPDVIPMAKIELFHSLLAPLLIGYGAYGVRRGEADMNALKYSLRILRAGHPMLISPEGTRTKTGELKEPHEGAAVIAVRSGVPILPVAMFGGKSFWSNLTRLRRTPIHAHIGKPLVLRDVPRKPSRQVLRAISDELMYYLAQMLPAKMRGLYADVDHFVPHYLVPQGATEIPPSTVHSKEVMPLPS